MDGPESERNGRPDCENRYKSILSSSYFTLLNLFGEFPLMDNHSTAGRFVGVFTAVVSQGVPVGLLFPKSVEYTVFPSIRRRSLQ